MRPHARGHLTPLAFALALLPTAIEAAQAPAATPAASDIEELVVFGRGETRQVQTVNGEQIRQLPPGTSPLKAIEDLPGVNFQSADPYGAYEWSTRISVRAFNQNQLGFTLDGVPLGDMSYGNHNGLHVSRAVISENVGRVVLSQGTGALGTASTSNLGGTLEFLTADPADELGVRASVTGGSEDSRRIHGRFDSGRFGPDTRLTLSYVDQEADKWKGDGVQEQRQANIKLVQPAGNATITGYYAWSDRAEQDYQDLSLDIIARNGEDTDNFFPDWNAAVAAANACAAAAFSAPICDDSYWNASGLREDHLAYLGIELPIVEGVIAKATVYTHENEGQGQWGTPYTPTPGGAPLSVRTTEYEIERAGIVTSLAWTLGDHEISGGLWYEDNDFEQARRFYGEPNVAAPTRSFLDFQNNPFFTQWQYKFKTETLHLHVQDSWNVNDTLTVNFGFKSVNVENEGEPVVATGSFIGRASSIEADEAFLPQVGFTWALGDEHEVFGGYAENVRAFVSAATAGPFSTTQSGFDAIENSLEPETSRTLELGWRYTGDDFQGVITAYHVTFDDRLLSVSLGAGIVGAPSALSNVGEVETNGVEVGMLWQPIEHVSLLASYSYTDSEYSDDVVSGTGAVTQTSGKTVVDTPENMFKAELGYDDGALFAKVGFDYIDERFFNYLNDRKVDDRTLVDLSVGYRLRGLGFVDEVTMQLNAVNITDENYISTVGSAGYGNSGDRQTLLNGAPAQYFFSVDARF